MIDFNPYDWSFHEDPYPIYQALREEAPCYRNEKLGFWALSRHEDVMTALKDWKTFSSADGVALEFFGPSASAVMSFLAMDPPLHDRVRALVSEGFTPRRVQRFEPRVRALANHYIDQFIERGSCEFVSEFAGRLPMDVISEMIGVPEGDRETIRCWADLVVHREEGQSEIPPEGVQASGNLLNYFQDMVTSYRKEPQEDLTSSLIAAEIDGDRLEDREIIAFLFLMAIAGNETTTKILTHAFYWLHQFPEQRARVEEDPSLIPAWVEETLRYDNSSQILYRTLTENLEMHGETMKKGDRVALLIGSANRDHRVFERPDEFDLSRDCGASTSFGRGVHFCLGASLARLETIVSLQEIQRRMSDIQLDRDRLVRAHSGNVRGFAVMPMAFRGRIKLA